MAPDDDIGSAKTLADGISATQATEPGAHSLSGPADLPTLLAERYEILGLLGAGGMGRVYRAHDRTLDEIVALKVLRRELVGLPGVLDRFRREVKLARRVTSPHVVRTFDLGQHGDDQFLTMEYVDGRSLAQLLEDGPLPLPEVMRIARAACAGIEAAHASGVLHRDLKPDNILVAKSGRIAITDFGIARVSSDPVRTGDAFAGTPAYMAPEQVEGAPEIGPRADIYAFGAILFEMLTGRRPFVGNEAFAVALARLREPPPDARAFRPVPDHLAELAKRCMARDPAERFADGAALGAELAQIQELGPAVHRASPTAAVPAKTSRSVAILPLRAPAELAELADGLAEEIADALSMTRALRVRALASVRAAASANADSREVGRALGVDVVVDGSIRRRADRVRIAARVIGVADGFQLWASHFDTGPEGLLFAGDEVVRAIARALTVDLDVPERASGDARLAEVYLESKARLRAGWYQSDLAQVIADLERAHAEAPDDPAIAATLAMALARSSVFGNSDKLSRARPLAERAVGLAPSSGEAWLALAFACLYSDEIADAARALRRAVAAAPSLAMAQGQIGAIVLDAGGVDDAITHLEAALSLDPATPNASDLARAYVYAGRHDEAFAMLERLRPRLLAEVAMARYRSWRGELAEITAPPVPGLDPIFAGFVDGLREVHRSRTLSASGREALERGVHVASPRLRAARAQFATEYALFLGEHDRALSYLRLSVESGLYDHTWIQRCPLLDPLRGLPAFAPLAAEVARRGQAVLDAIHAGGNAA